jgi:hypothetical protein
MCVCGGLCVCVNVCVGRGGVCACVGEGIGWCVCCESRKVIETVRHTGNPTSSPSRVVQNPYASGANLQLQLQLQPLVRADHGSHAVPQLLNSPPLLGTGAPAFAPYLESQLQHQLQLQPLLRVDHGSHAVPQLLNTPPLLGTGTINHRPARGMPPIRCHLRRGCFEFEVEE